MLMVDRVELVPLNQLEHVGKLDRQHSTGSEEPSEPLDEIVDVWNMSQHIVGHNQLGLLASRRQLVRELGPEEPGQSGDTGSLGDCRDVCGGFDSQHWLTSLDEVA